MVKEGLINLDFADVRAVMREMGKAMMGTGEAAGEKRALSAAEAAISNPLIDDASMKGAKGLLISITGGRDLTLYEVDEAATRIREEVDPEANIIVGATFDENLEGMIRVSVVATGIDHAADAKALRPAAAAAPVSTPESRLAELTQKLRADQQRLSERIERTGRSDQPAPQAAATPPNAAHSHDAIENAARAAVAAAVLPGTTDDVTIRPMQPKPSLFPEPSSEPRAEFEPPSGAFIPPTPERSANRGQRMPRIDELPVPAQNELRAMRGEAGAGEAPEKRRMGLLQRLASVGLGSGRREDEASEAEQPQHPRMGPIPQPPNRPMQPRPTAQRPPEQVRPSEPVSEYARRPAHQGLDPLGRQAPVNNSHDEDQLDIPAFLRRQAK
jgi:cell division protein FtsZ